MLKIGDFSKLAHVTIKTLRHYDEIGLLKPEWIDRYTGYRYYTLEQLPRLNRILALKDLGFSLQQIDSILNDNLPVEQLRGMVRMRQAELQRQIEANQMRLAQVETRLLMIEQEGRMPGYEVVLRPAEPLTIVSAHGLVSTRDQLSQRRKEMTDSIMQYVQQNQLDPAGSWMTLYYDREFRERLIEVEVALPILPPRKTPPRCYVNVRKLEGVQSMACVIHSGDLESITQAYTEFYRWARANGSRVMGMAREVYLDGGPENLEMCRLVELQIPIDQSHPHGLDRSTNMTEMAEPKIVNLPAFWVVGTRYQGKNENHEISVMWEKDFLPVIDTLPRVEPDCSYGICYMEEGLPEGEFVYLAAVKVEKPGNVPDNMVAYQMPAQKYLVFSHRGSLVGLKESYRYIYETYLPQKGYRRSEGPDMEYYTADFNAFNENSILYLYVPIE